MQEAFSLGQRGRGKFKSMTCTVQNMKYKPLLEKMFSHENHLSKRVAVSKERESSYKNSQPFLQKDKAFEIWTQR